MEDLEKIYQFFDGKIDRLGLTSSDLRIIANNNKNNTELVNKTLSTYKREGTGKSGSYGMWNHPRGLVWNVFVRPASS